MSLFESSTIRKEKRDEGQLTPDVKQRIVDTRELCSQITIQIPYRATDGIHPELAKYFPTWVNAGIELMPFRDGFGGFIDIQRAHMCTDWLRQSQRRFLVMIDNDVVPMNAEDPVKLCGHDLPVMSGVACGLRPGTGTFACVAVKDQTGVARFPTTMDTVNLPAGGVRKIECCGAGCLAIRRDVLETMKELPFLLPQELRVEAARTGALRKSEDIFFGEQVQRAGYDLWVDFSVHCFHDKMIPLHWPKEQIDEALTPEDFDVTQRGLAVEMK